MNKVLCENNHFFDIDEFDVCPMCGSSVKRQKSIVPQDVPQKKKAKEVFRAFGLFERRKEEPTVVPDEPPFVQKPPYYDVDTPTDGVYRGNGKDNNGDVETQGKYSVGSGTINDDSDETLGKYGENEWLDYSSADEDDVESKTDNGVGYVRDNQSIDDADDSEKFDENLEETIPLSDVIKKVSANSDGHTTGYFSSMTKIKNEEKAKPKESFNSEPIVGWLACVGGLNFGECFSLFSGRNSIGRNSTNEVCINKDESVSRDKHAFIIYEPEHREFVLQPGDGRQLTYLNGASVYSVTKIKNKDIIKIGNTKLMFVPLCDSTFSWEDYLTKE